MASVGLNKDYHGSPYGQRGGLSTFPVSGIVSGFELSLGGTANDGVNAGDTTLAEVVISAGSARFDGFLKKLSADLTATIPSGGDLATDDIVVPVYLNPPRAVVPYTTVEPSGSEGDYALKSVLYDANSIGGAYYMVDDIMIYKSGSWVAVDPLSELPAPGEGHNALPLNEIGDAIVAANIAATNEIPIFLGSKLPPHVPASNAMLRQSAGIFLGEITYSGGSGTITKTLPEYHMLSV